MRAAFSQFGRYLAFAVWFFKDALLRYRGRLVLLVLANALGIGLQALGVVIAYRYASAVETGKAIHLLGYVFEPRASLGLLAVTAMSVFLVMVAAGALVMRARVEGAAVALDYGEYCRRRIYYLVSRQAAVLAGHRTGDLTRQRFLELARRDASYCALVLRIIAHSLRNVGTAIVAAVALIFLNFALTLVILPIFLVAVLLLRVASISGASRRSQLQHLVGERSNQRRLEEDRVLRSPVPLPSIETNSITSGSTEDPETRYRLAELGQRRALEQGRFIAQSAMGLALFLVLLVLGTATLGEGSNWSALLVYVAALIFFGTSMARVSRLMVSINRFYPALARHARFVEGAERELAAGSSSSQPIAYFLDTPELASGPRSTLEVAPGQRYALLLPDELTRYSLSPLAKALLPLPKSEGRWAPFPWFVCAGPSVGEGSLREKLGLPDDCSVEGLKAAISSLETGGAEIRIPWNLDEPLSRAEQERLSPEAMFVLMVFSGILRRAILVLEHKGLSLLKEPLRTSLLRRASGCIVFVAHRATRVEDVGRYDESAIVVSGMEELFGWARIERFRAGDEAVMRAIAKSAGESRAVTVTPVGEEDLDELE